MPNKIYTGTLRLSAGHSLLVGHLPESISLASFSEALAQHHQNVKSIDSFGFFGDGMNYNTYYPDLNVEDLAPKENEFIFPTYRMLSEVIVHKGWNPVDFSMNGVLKGSMNKMVAQTVNTDHETSVGNAVGVVKEVFWQNSYKDAAGKTVPAGFNAKLKIDGKANPRLARGIMMDPPAIHSNSVTITFGWEKSHSKMDDQDFMNKLGKFDEKGAMIRRIATEISAYSETSLVNHGADPYAKKIGADGKLINPDMSRDRYYNFSEQSPGKPNAYYFMDYSSIAEDKFSLSAHPTTPPKSINDEDTITNSDNMKQLLLSFAALFAINTEGLEEDALESKVSDALAAFTKDKDLEGGIESFIANSADKSDLESKVTDLQNQVKTLGTEKTELESYKDIAEKALSELRTESERLYKLTLKEGTDPDAGILSLINGANYDTAKSLGKQYRELVKAGLSSKAKGAGEENNNEDFVPKEYDELREDILNKNKATYRYGSK